MIDPAIVWIEMHSVPKLKADLVANQVELLSYAEDRPA